MGRPLTPAVDRFAEKVALTDSGCLEWIACLDKDGYGKFTRGGSTADRHTRAHRWSYEHHVGPIPEGLVIDHLYIFRTERRCRECGRAANRAWYARNRKAS